MIRSRAVFALSLLCVFWGAGPAFGLATGVGGGTSLGAGEEVQVFCNGDCGDFALPDAPSGFGLAFAARVLRDGTHVDVFSSGNVLVRGPVRVTGDVSIQAGSAAFQGGTITMSATGPDVTGASITLDASGGLVHGAERFEVALAGQVTLLSSPSIRLGSANVVGRTSGGTIRLGGADLLAPEVVTVGLDAGLVLASSIPPQQEGLFVAAVDAAPLPVAPLPEASGTEGQDVVWQIHLDGDVYLDLSGVELGSLRVTSKKTVLFTDTPWVPVPEPGTALLLGLGLAALTTTRRSSSGASIPIGLACRAAANGDAPCPTLPSVPSSSAPASVS